MVAEAAKERGEAQRGRVDTCGLRSVCTDDLLVNVLLERGRPAKQDGLVCMGGGWGGVGERKGVEKGGLGDTCISNTCVKCTRTLVVSRASEIENTWEKGPQTLGRQLEDI